MYIGLVKVYVVHLIVWVGYNVQYADLFSAFFYTPCVQPDYLAWCNTERGKSNAYPEHCHTWSCYFRFDLCGLNQNTSCPPQQKEKTMGRHWQAAG